MSVVDGDRQPQLPGRSASALRGRKVLLVAGASFGLIAVGTSCAAHAAAPAAAGAGTAAVAYSDGTYPAAGDYSSPGGPESVTATLTVKDGVVSAVTITNTGHSANAKRYQDAFSSGIDQVVVGKPLATLTVGAVSGSSLTPGGFNAAVEKIRSEAS